MNRVDFALVLGLGDLVGLVVLDIGPVGIVDFVLVQ